MDREIEKGRTGAVVSMRIAQVRSERRVGVVARPFLAGPQCPECRTTLVRRGGCLACPHCGWGSCE